MDVDTVQRYLNLFREKLANKLGGLTSEVHEEMQLTLNESLPKSEGMAAACFLYPQILIPTPKTGKTSACCRPY